MIKRSGFAKEIIHNKFLYLMMLPGTLLILVFNYLPIPGIMIAFKNFTYYGNIIESFNKSRWAGLKNFEMLFRTPDAMIMTRNTVLYNSLFILLGLVCSITVAVFINELGKTRIAKLYQTTFLFPYFLSWVVVGYIVYSFLNVEYGILNKTILPLLGKDGVQWYMDPIYWPFILTLCHLWKFTGYNSIVYLAAISGIDNEYYEAAAIDGATRWQQIKNIMLPMIKPQIVILTILAIGRMFSADFGLFYNVPLGSGILFPATTVIDTYVYTIMRSGDYSVAAAAGLYQALVGFILVMAANGIVKKINPENSLF